MTLAFIFSDVGAGEWLMLLVVILVVMGPKRLPETARKFGHYYSKFRRAAESFKRQLLEMDTELTQAVADVEKEASDAFTVDDTAGDPAADSSDDGYGDYRPDSPYPGYDEDMNAPDYFSETADASVADNGADAPSGEARAQKTDAGADGAAGTSGEAPLPGSAPVQKA
jgi:Tat protein translocase TatB subunit